MAKQEVKARVPFKLRRSNLQEGLQSLSQNGHQCFEIGPWKVYFEFVFPPSHPISIRSLLPSQQVVLPEKGTIGSQQLFSKYSG